MWMDEIQAEEIAAAIQAEFPDIPGIDKASASLLYGNESGITTLDIS
jgi:hypothetical protein